MKIQEYRELFLLNIGRIKEEIMAYSSDEQLWAVAPGISNAGGNLCLHLWGNLHHFIGATLAHTGFIRNREEEFSQTGLSKTQLLSMMDEIIGMLEKSMDALSDADLLQDYPLTNFGTRSTEWILIKLLVHFDYHLGQINYHRRMTR